jgi:hypothetical protein
MILDMEHLTSDGLKDIVAIRYVLKNGLPEGLK